MTNTTSTAATNIKVCDAIMGSGKTTAVINMMNNNPNQRFIYITETLDEDVRIMNACPALKFARPGYVGRGTKRTRVNKSDHIHDLIAAGRNICTTHKLFTMLDGKTWQLAKSMDYIMIIDEEPTVTERCTFGPLDILALEAAGVLERRDDGSFDVHDTEAPGQLRTLIRKCKTGSLMTCTKTDMPRQMWTMYPDAFTAFKEVYIMTYQFEHSMLQYYMATHGLTYTNIYIAKAPDGTVSFTDQLCYIPSYVGHLSQLIHIFENEELNEIGNDPTAFSASWLKTATKQNTANGKRIKSNLRRYYTEFTGDIHGSKRMFGTTKEAAAYLKRNGWSAAYVPFNQRATNKYADRTNLVYYMNIFMHPDVKNYLIHHDIKPDEDGYALAIFVQWIWRSAIRNGEEILLYVPSKRMRGLLKGWIAECEDAYHAFYESKEVA